MKATKPIDLFCSYSHKDEELRDELENHLSILKRQGVVSQCSARERRWRSECNSSRAIIALSGLGKLVDG